MKNSKIKSIAEKIAKKTFPVLGGMGIGYCIATGIYNGLFMFGLLGVFTPVIIKIIKEG